MFELRDIGADAWTVLVSGWAFDGRLLADLDWDTNVALWQGDEGARLPVALQGQPWRHVTLLGWSMGSYAVARAMRERSLEIERVVLVGARPHYPLEQLIAVQEAVTRNVTVFLRKFYRDSFCAAERDLYHRFRRHYETGCLARFTVDRLLAELEWMGQQTLESEDLRNVRDLVIIHGREDAIAPWSELEPWLTTLPHARVTCLEATGHVPFWHPEFMDCL